MKGGHSGTIDGGMVVGAGMRVSGVTHGNVEDRGATVDVTGTARTIRRA